MPKEADMLNRFLNFDCDMNTLGANKPKQLLCSKYIPNIPGILGQ